MSLPLTYHWRNLFVRKTTTLLTVLVVAAVVGVFTWIMGFAAALDRSLSMATDGGKLIVLRRGATSESNSAIPVNEYNRLNQLEELARDPETNEPLLSPTMMVQVALPRVRDGGRTLGNVAVRGVTDAAFAVHRNVKVVGSHFSPGQREVIVGLAAAKQFEGLGIKETINLGYGNDRQYLIVGHFTVGGGPMESEVWGYLPSLMDAYQRSMYSSAFLRLRDGADPQQAIERIGGPAIQLASMTEAQYWQMQSGNVRRYLFVTYVLAVVMALAAVFSIANTMFATVAGRTSEVAMLRTIGYSGRQIMFGLVLESIFLSLLGGVVGCLGCAVWLAVVGNTKDMFGAFTFTTMAFEIRLTLWTIVSALVAVTVVGAIGAFVPALRAARLGVVSALREP